MTGENPARGDEHIKEITYDIRKLIHQLNQATIGPPDLTRPSTVHVLLGDLDWASLGLSQTLKQLKNYLLSELQAGRLTHTDDLDVPTTIGAVIEALVEARGHIARLGEALHTAEYALRPIHPLPAPQVAATDFPVPITQALDNGHPPTPAGTNPPVARPATPDRKPTTP